MLTNGGQPSWDGQSVGDSPGRTPGLRTDYEPDTSRAKWGGQARKWMRRSRVVYTPLSLGFLGYLLWKDPAGILTDLSSIQSTTVVAVFLLVAIGHACIGFSTHFILVSLHHRLDVGRVLYIHVSRLPARYLPGGVWQTVARAHDFLALGLPRSTILRLVALELWISACLAAFLGGLVLLGTDSPVNALWLSLLALTGGVGLAVTPHLARIRLRGEASVAIASYAAAVCSFALVWGLYGSAFYLFVSQMIPGLDWPHATGTYLVSWLAGFLAVFAPQGIGVFEVTSSFLLTGSLAAGLAASLFAFRALLILSDMGVWLIFHLCAWMTTILSALTHTRQVRPGATEP